VTVVTSCLNGFRVIVSPTDWDCGKMPAPRRGSAVMACFEEADLRFWLAGRYTFGGVIALYQGKNSENILDEDSLLEKKKEINRLSKEKAESQYQRIARAIRNCRQEKEHRQSNLDYGVDVSAKNILNERRNAKDLKRKSTFQVGDNVKIWQEICQGSPRIHSRKSGQDQRKESRGRL
jgi:hypothetical protein